MSKSDAAEKNFVNYNCAQSVLTAYAEDYNLSKDQALSVSVAFGGGIGRLQETCGAVTGALMALGLSSNFKEGDTRDKINKVYDEAGKFIDDFIKENGTIKCRDLLGCDLKSEEGHKYFVENKLREKKCQAYIRFACELLEKYRFK